MGAGDPYINFDQVLSAAVLTAREDRAKAVRELKVAIDDSDVLRTIAEERLERYEGGAFPSSAYAGHAKSLLAEVLGTEPRSEQAA